MNKKILISSIVVLLVVISYLNVVDKVSSGGLDRAFTRSISVFAIARTLNGIISVVEGTQVAATPAGVGVNFAVGQIVHPMNDMLEHFSWVMMMSSISLGVQKLMLELGQTDVMKVLLTLNAILLVLMLWTQNIWQKNIFNSVFKSFVILSFLRFIIPLVVLFNSSVYEYILQPKYIEAKTALIFSSDEIKGIVNQVEANQQKQIRVQNDQEDSVIQKAQNYFNETIETLNVTKQLQTLKIKFKKLLDDLENKFDHAIEYILVLMTVFIVESILFPLLFFWVFMRLLRNLLQMDLSNLHKENRLDYKS